MLRGEHDWLERGAIPAVPEPARLLILKQTPVSLVFRKAAGQAFVARLAKGRPVRSSIGRPSISTACGRASLMPSNSTGTRAWMRPSMSGSLLLTTYASYFLCGSRPGRRL